MSYCFHPAAEAEHLETVAYFESKRAGLLIPVKGSCRKIDLRRGQSAGRGLSGPRAGSPVAATPREKRFCGTPKAKTPGHVSLVLSCRATRKQVTGNTVTNLFKLDYNV